MRKKGKHRTHYLKVEFYPDSRIESFVMQHRKGGCPHFLYYDEIYGDYVFEKDHEFPDTQQIIYGK